MKIIKKKIIWFSICGLMGLALITAGALTKNDMARSFGIGLFTVSLIKIIQFLRISKNKQLLEKFELQQQEERMIFLAEKSGRLAFLSTILIELIAVIILIIMNYASVGTAIAGIVCVQTLIYLVIYLLLSKKY